MLWFKIGIAINDAENLPLREMFRTLSFKEEFGVLFASFMLIAIVVFIVWLVTWLIIQVVKSIKQQKIVCEKYPGAMASECFMELAKRICESPTPSLPDGSNRFFWKNLFMRKYD